MVTNQGRQVPRDQMFYRFSAYGFLKNLRLFEPFILLIFRSYGLSYLQIGLLYSIRDLAANFLEIPTGLLADSFGRRKAMVSSFLCYILSFLLFFFFRDFWVLAGAMVIFAGGEAFRTGTHKALILEYLRIKNISDLKVAYYGLTRSASQLGSALNALLAGGLVFFTGNFRLIFLISTIPYLLDLVNLASYPRELDGQISPVHGREIWVRFKSILGGFVEIFRQGSQIRPLLNSSSYSGVFKASKDYLQPILAAWALSMTFLPDLERTRREALIIGAVYFLIFLLTSFASRNAYQVSGYFGSPRKAVNVTYLIGVTALLLSGLSASQGWQVMAVLFFIGLFLVNNIRRPINIGVISDQISSRIMASGLSAEAQLTTIFSAILAPTLGFLADRFGLGSGITLLGLLMYGLFLPVRLPKEGDEGGAF